MVLVRSMLGRHLFAFVWLPRDDVSTDRRLAIGELLAERSHGVLLNWTMALEDGQIAMVRYTFDLRAEADLLRDIARFTLERDR